MKFVVQKCPFCNGFLEFVAENIVRCLNCDKRFPMIQEDDDAGQDDAGSESCSSCSDGDGLEPDAVPSDDVNKIYAGRGADLSILNMQCRERGHTQRIELNVSDI